MVEDQQQSGDGGGNGLLETIKQRPGLYGGIGALVVAALATVVVLAIGGGDDGGDPEEPGAPGGTTSTTVAAPAVTTPTGGATAEDTVPGDETPAPAVTVDRNPLDGSPLDGTSSNRVVAVKVDNAPEAGPAIGIQDAELIMEMPVEGGLTRLTAMFFENRPTVIGPIRSVRPVDADLLSPWRPLLVTTGGQSFVYREILAAGVDILDEGTDGLFQRIERREPYHLVATIPLVAEEAGEGAPPVSALPFGDDELGGASASGVAVPFSGVADVAWTYDSATDQYTRTVNGEPYEIFPEYNADLTGFSTDTVIVLKAAQRSAGYTDAAGSDVPTFDVIGFGDVMVFHGGEVKTGQWLRAAQSDGWFFLDEAGNQFTVPVGRVWMEIVPRYVDVTVR